MPVKLLHTASHMADFPVDGHILFVHTKMELVKYEQSRDGSAKKKHERE